MKKERLENNKRLWEIKNTRQKYENNGWKIKMRKSGMWDTKMKKQKIMKETIRDKNAQFEGANA